MSDSEASPPPVTGVDAIDDVLAGLHLGNDVAEHPAELARAVDALAAALRDPARQ